MRPWLPRVFSIGAAWLCFAAAGCGGGDVPDPEADGTAATESAPEGGEGAPAPAVAEAPPAAPAQAGSRPGTPPAGAPAQGDVADDQPGEPALAEGEKPAAKSEGGSSTAEMLALATGNQASAGTDAAQGQSPQAGGPPGGNPMMMQGRPGGMGGGPPGMARGPGSGGPMAGMSGMAAGTQMAGAQPSNMAGMTRPPGMQGGPGGANDGQAQMRAQMQAQMQRSPGAMAGNPGMAGGRPGGMPGYPGSQGGIPGQGGPGQNDPPGDTRTPRGAVQAFLNALKAKDRDRLAEATALRSQEEAASQKVKELFAKIVDMSISDSELDDLAKRFEGFQVAGENAAKSTARLGVYIDKPTDNGSLIRRTLTVRKEKKGWGVMDVSAPTEFRGVQNSRRPARG